MKNVHVSDTVSGEGYYYYINVNKDCVLYFAYFGKVELESLKDDMYRYISVLLLTLKIGSLT